MTLQRAALVAVALLALAHHDAWFWDDPTAIGGVVPVGLAYHAGFSVLAAALWGFITRVAWPSDPFASGDEP